MVPPEWTLDDNAGILESMKTDDSPKSASTARPERVTRTLICKRISLVEGDQYKLETAQLLNLRAQVLSCEDVPNQLQYQGPGRQLWTGGHVKLCTHQDQSIDSGRIASEVIVNMPVLHPRRYETEPALDRFEARLLNLNLNFAFNLVRMALQSTLS